MQKKLILSILAITVSVFSIAQDLRLNLFGGLANYSGDLQDKADEDDAEQGDD